MDLVCLFLCRSLPCAAMLMYDYPLKTDMESVSPCAPIMPQHVFFFFFFAVNVTYTHACERARVCAHIHLHTCLLRV